MHNVIEVTSNYLAVRGRMENHFLCSSWAIRGCAMCFRRVCLQLATITS